MISACNGTLRALMRSGPAFRKHGIVPWQTRADRLMRLRDLVRDYRGAIATAINADFGQRSRHETELPKSTMCSMA